jgi:hypothetical protein
MGIETALIVATAASVAVGAAGTIQSSIQARKAGSARRKAVAAENRKQEIQNRRSRRSAIREAQVKRASIVNFAQGGDFGESSPVSQATGSISSQLGTNIGFSEAVSANNREIGFFSQKAANLDQSSQLFQSIGSLGFQGASFFGGFSTAGGGGSFGLGKKATV